MEKVFVNGRAVCLEQVAENRVEVKLWVETSEDVELRLMIEEKLQLHGALLDRFAWVNEVAIVTNFSSIGEAKSFLISECDNVTSRSLLAS